MIKKRFVLPALAAAAAVLLAGCAPTGGAADSRPAGDFKVVATTTQVADFTRNVLGDTPGASVTQLIQPNQSAHSYDPSVADLAALGEADVLVVNGVGLEEWLSDAISASGFGGVSVTAAAGIKVLGGTEKSGNPHIWTDVANAETMVQTIADGLSSASVDQAAVFAANAATYSGRLAELDAWIRTNIDAVPAAQRLLVSNHDAFGYFTAAYGITYVGSIIPSFDDNAEPSAAAIDQLVAAIRATGVKAVFSEASISPKAADTIAREAGVRVYSGEDALYSDSLGARGSNGATYIGAQVHNVTRILESWGATPTPVPADLR
ncbi:metal ABC transporter substrate-binding protein [Cryobacterium fucosi]|uniref:Zinc ABC transporter substrate-binding protein n=1 Tax=Cryobacterium fucosi TaxID=1259157 RepID=A0A4V3IW58_9MICO|nr:metal ABC transporter substrate-binding protein [Cryobacterium fucosi]TFD83370.1 zinc ABC transporter substrate-binding protein [Cryobacterium fucosi]